jgi:hypothetical protein
MAIIARQDIYKLNLGKNTVIFGGTAAGWNDIGVDRVNSQPVPILNMLGGATGATIKGVRIAEKPNSTVLYKRVASNYTSTNSEFPDAVFASCL